MKLFFERFKPLWLEIVPLLIIGMGIFLRFFSFDRQSLWGDELYSVYGASLKEWPSIWNFMLDDPHPPLFQLLLNVWNRIYPTEVGLKLFPILISIANLLIIFILTRKWDRKISLVFLFFMAFSPGAIFYAQEVRSYSLLLALSSFLGIYFIEIFTGNNSKRTLWIFLVLSVIISYVHIFGFIFAGILTFVAWISLLYQKSTLKNWFLSIGIVLLISFLPFLYILSVSQKIGTAGWIEKPNLILYTLFYSLFFYTSKRFLFLTFFIPIFFLCYTIFNFKKWVSKKNDGSKELLLTAFLIILLTSIFSLFKPILTTRNLIVVLPLVYLAMAQVISKLTNFRSTIIGLIVLTMFSLLDFKKNFYKVFKEDWRGLPRISKNYCPEATLYTDYHPEFIELYGHWQNLELTVKQTLNADFKGESSICVIRSLVRTSVDNTFLGKNFQKLDTKTIFGFQIEKYDRIKL